MTPKEDPEAKADRLRQRRIANAESLKAAKSTAKDLQGDVASVYGLPSMFSRSK
ncbi:hypothetical protein KM176_16515 [Pseudooceanicola sp. CBS1P-1]|uniref:Uncharacterized protein n=1 Tax=Pseudooceanicola albus TaxID=2692189 RepID=A0A6L7G5E5_9RHOB|nr:MULTISPECIES: hypothetical protein [Pseudooceanicola]MBT9385479.1 hypothetical protein [Pseudooceanicola endophyticus]MXN19109.1 hypothetical protein [Pseudooceanicola albus]